MQSTQKWEVNNLFVQSIFQFCAVNIFIILLNFWRHYIRFITCGEFPDIVTLLSTIRSPIATDCGVIYRKETIMKHLSSEYHNKCIISYQKKIEGTRQSDKTPLSNYISKDNSDLAYKIGSLLIIRYYDEKKLVLPEYSFPARAVMITWHQNLNIILMIILLRIPIYNI